MDLEVSKEEIINNFFMFDNNDGLSNNNNLNEVTDLFSSDILIIPFCKIGGGFRSSEDLNIKVEFNDEKLKIMHYNGNDQIFRQISKFSLLDIIYLGTIVISTVSGLITIKEFLARKYNEKHISIHVYILNKNCKYNYIIFEDKASNFNNVEANISNFDETDILRTSTSK